MSHVALLEKFPDATDIPRLLEALGDADPVRRQEARDTLVAMGVSATAGLVRLLRDPRPHVRWEAAKALSCIVDPGAAPALVATLDDDDFNVRWVVTEALIALRRAALEPLLAALTVRAESPGLREGASHVLRSLARRGMREIVRPVLVALRQFEPEVAVPPVAYAVLKILRSPL